MTSIVFTGIAVAIISTVPSSSMADKNDNSSQPIQLMTTSNIQSKTTGEYNNIASKLSNITEYSYRSYCQFGGYLQYLTLQCEQPMFLNMKTRLSETEKPPEIQMMALLVSAIAVGCKETSLFLSQLLVQNYRNQQNNSQCLTIFRYGPKENTFLPCDKPTNEHILEQFKLTEKLRILYDVSSGPLFITLGCHELGQKSSNALFHDLNLDDNSIRKNTVQIEGESTEKKGSLVMNYIYKHTSDIQRTQQLIESVENADIDNPGSSTNVNDSNSTSGYGLERQKRSAAEIDIEEHFNVKHSCFIFGSIGVTLNSVSKSDCLQLCFEDENCRSAGYANNNSKQCQLNTEIESEVGSFFTCGHDNGWNYYEKKTTVYFLISSKVHGGVIQASSSKSLKTSSFNGDDTQYWFWKGDVIHSKKYSEKVLTRETHSSFPINVFLENNNGKRAQKWNFGNDVLQSQHDGGCLHTNINGEGKVFISKRSLSRNDKWSLGLARFYFLITCRQSGKVLDVSLGEESGKRVHMWSYTGGDNQLWFWDDDNIRSKQFSGKVLDLHMEDYIKNGWGKVYLHPFHGGDNQRWTINGDNIISNYKQLRLDVKYGKQEDGAEVGGYPNSGNPNQQWTLGTIRTFFFILNKNSGRVLDATSRSEVKQWYYYGGKTQLWFWDGDVIRNKHHADRVIDRTLYSMHGSNRIFLNSFTGYATQQWEFSEGFLKSRYSNLYLGVPHGSRSDGTFVAILNSKSQKWSLTPEHDFFTITNRQNTKVLDAPDNNKVHMWSYHGQDHQLWFWDDNSIRSKKYPEKVLDLHMHDYEKHGWGKVYLYPYHGGNNQRWTVQGDLIVSKYKNLRFDIEHGNTGNKAKVGGYIDNGGSLNQKWSLNSKERIFFTIKGVESGKVLDVFGNLDIGIWGHHGKDNQLWYWDKDSIRSKKYPDKVVDLHMTDFNKNGWGKIYLHTYHGGQNQKWKLEGKSIICEFRQLRLDTYESAEHNGALVGGYRETKNSNQKWIINIAHGTSCIDKTEEDIYNIVQWIPLISTLWDLFSSIGYASAGCTSVAEERAISMAIGTVMDVVTIATGGAASGLSTVVKTGVKVGIKFGLKQGLKATVKISQQSIKHLIKNAAKGVAKNGIHKALAHGIKKSGKRLLKEIIVDPAMLYKNVGKITKKILTNPVKTFKQSWKAVSKQIDNLKHLKRNFDEFRKGTKAIKDVGSNTLKLRCKRGGLFSCPAARNGYTEAQQRQYKNLLDNNIPTENIDTCANRYIALRGRDYDRAPKFIKDKMEGLSTDTERAELFAAFQYTEESGAVNLYVQKVLDGHPLIENKEILKTFSESVDENYYQATLLQSYLKKRPLNNPTTVYRFEEQFRDTLYENGQVYTAKRFMSTTKQNVRINDYGINLSSKTKYPIEITMHLKRSGVDLSDISKYPSQDELLVPIGTKFNVQRENVIIEGNPITKVTLTEI